MPKAGTTRNKTIGKIGGKTSPIIDLAKKYDWQPKEFLHRDSGTLDENFGADVGRQSLQLLKASLD